MRKIIIVILCFLLISCSNEVSDNNLNAENIMNTDNEINVFEEVNEEVKEESDVESESSSELISSDHIELDEPIKTIRVLVNTLNVRESADINGQVTQQVNMNDVFHVYEIEESNDETWYKVVLEDKQTGWLASWFCSDIVSFIELDSVEGYAHSIIDVDVLNVRKSPTTESSVIGKTYLNQRYTILDTIIDEEDRIWYKIHHEIGVDGWIAGWFCREGLYANKARFDAYDDIVGLPTNKNDFINLMSLDEFNLENILDYYGDDYTKDSNHYSEFYTYSNGIIVRVRDDGRISVEDNERKFRRISSSQYELFTDEGKETLITYEVGIKDYVLILNEERDVLCSFVIRNVYLNELFVGDFLNDGKNSIYINTRGSKYKEKNIYAIENDKLVKKYDLLDLSLFNDAIEVELKDKVLQYKIDINNQVTEGISQLPNNLFYSNTEKNDLISFERVWDVIESNGKWYIKGRIDCNLFLFDYLWGPPSAYNDPEYMYPFSTSLIQLDIFLEINDGTFKFANSELRVKYDSISDATQILDAQDLRLVDGPWLDMDLVEAYEMLGGQGTLEESQFIIDGVTCYEEFGQVVSIHVASDQYQNVNGLKVGLSLDEVEQILGKPQVGYSGDPYVEYKSFYSNSEDYYMNYYRYLVIEYKDDKVLTFSMNQIVLD